MRQSCPQLKTERHKRGQNGSRQIMYGITGPEQKRPNNFQDALHNDHFKKALLRFMTSTWGQEECVTIL